LYIIARNTVKRLGLLTVTENTVHCTVELS
jgi:hypothetical protein